MTIDLDGVYLHRKWMLTGRDVEPAGLAGTGAPEAAALPAESITLPVRELRRLVDAAGEMELGVTGMAELLAALIRLVPCDQASWCRLDLARRAVLDLVEVPESSASARDAARWEEAFWAHYQQHPLCNRPRPPVVSIRDVLDTRSWHATGLYQEYLKPQGGEHEIKIDLPHPADQTHVILLDRGPGRDFDDRDHLLLELIRPHLLDAVQRLRRRDVPAAAVSPRERDVLDLVRHGQTNAEIARRLCVTESTVRKHLENVYSRLGVHSRTGALARLDALSV